MSSAELGSGDTVVTSAPSPTESPSITALTNTTDWRPYTFEHPLTAVTSAMLNISGGPEDPSSGSFGSLYDYHIGSKLGQISQIQYLSHSEGGGAKTEKTISADIWSPVVVSSIGNGSKANGDVSDVYVPAIHQSKLNSASVLRRGESKLQKLSHNANLSEHSGQNGQSRYANSNGGGDMSPHHHSHHSPPPHSIHPLHPGHGGHILHNPHTGVIVLKEEGPHSPGSPRNGLTSLHVSGPPTPPSHLSPTPVSAHDPDEDQGHYQSPQLFATLSNPSHPSHGSPYDFVGGGNVGFPPNLRGGGGGNVISSVYPVGNSPTEPYYRVDFFANEFGASGVTTASRQLSPYDGGPEGPSFVVDRYVRGGGSYKQVHGGHGGLPVDLPSPDSGIGTEAITPRDSSQMQQGFDYTELCQQGLINEMGGSNGRASPATSQHSQSQPKSTRPWHDFGRQNEADKIQIPKLFTTFGFRYYLESPISTSQRRDDDRITYINKGQFYGITLDFLTDADKPIKSQTVKTVVMLVFREEKSPDDEIKAWQFWHGRQHSVKQRILDADTKNSVGLVGCIDEIAHNAIAVYWNPMESSAKINVAVQCLSTDFSSQKGVKGLPLHLQIDTYDDPRDPNCPISHRGYCQIKVFCDKGAERKTRDEERRAAKRKLTANGRKKVDDLYHMSAERSEFYSMCDLTKPPVLFTPAEDIDKLTSLELHGFYSTHSEGSDQSGALGLNHEERVRMMRGSGQDSPPRSSPPPHLSQGGHHPGSQGQGTTTLKFHHNFPPDSPPSYIRHTSTVSTFNPMAPPGPPGGNGNSNSNSPPPPPPLTHQPVSVISNGEKRKDDDMDLDLSQNELDGRRGSGGGGTNGHSSSSENSVNDRVFPTSPSSCSSLKRMRLLPPPSQRLMIYVRQEGEEAFTPLHLVPPSRETLLKALEEKYEISLESLRHLFRRNAKGILAKVDDEMLRHYCHEDSFLLQMNREGETMDITLTEETNDTLSS